MRIRDTDSGEIFRLEGDFETLTRDWNNDGDVYPAYGAFFTSEKDNRSMFINASWIGTDEDYFEIIER